MLFVEHIQHRFHSQNPTLAPLVEVGVLAPSGGVGDLEVLGLRSLVLLFQGNWFNQEA